MSRTTAFTLVELIVAIGVIAIVAAIFLPSLAASKKAANATASLSNLHQIAIASQLYQQDEGDFPRTVAQLYPALIKSPQVLVSPNDHSRVGAAQAVCSRVFALAYRGECDHLVGLKISYIGRSEIEPPAAPIPKSGDLEAWHQPGLFVDLSSRPGTNENDWVKVRTPPYHRVTYDGGIVKRTGELIDMPYQGLTGTCSSFRWYFFDFKPEAKLAQCLSGLGG